MTDAKKPWESPIAREIKMDAEISSYQADEDPSHVPFVAPYTNAPTEASVEACA